MSEGAVKFESISKAEVTRRESFAHKITVKHKMAGVDKLISSQVKTFNREKSEANQKYTLSIVSSETGEPQTLQLLENQSGEGVQPQHVLEVDFVGEKTQIRTNDLDYSLQALNDFRTATGNAKGIGAVQFLLGKDTRVAIENMLEAEKYNVVSDEAAIPAVVEPIHVLPSSEAIRRKSFSHRLEYNPNIASVKDPLKDVQDQVERFNAAKGKAQEKYFVTIRDIAEDNTHSIQIWEKNVVTPGSTIPANRHLVDLDFIGNAQTEICTNDLDQSAQALADIAADSTKEIPLLKFILGNEARGTIAKASEAAKLVPQPEKVLPNETTEMELHKGGPLARMNEIVKYVAQGLENWGQKKEIVKYVAPEGGPNKPTTELAVRKSKPEVPKPKLTEMHMAVVSAVEQGYEMTFLNAFGKEVTRTVKSKDVITQSSKRFARMQMSETANKREAGLVQTTKTFVERAWRGILTKNIHEKKEEFHGIELMAAAGVETGITAEFNTAIDKMAREQIDAERSAKWGGKFFGGVKDFFQESIGHERDLHKQKVLITAKLRSEYMSNPSDEKNPIYSLIQRDTLAREALAENVMNSPVDFLHSGDKKTAEFKVAIGSELDVFLKQEVLLKIKDDVITHSKDANYNGRISEKLRVELDQKISDFMFSEKFRAYVDKLPADDQSKFEKSFTYGTNILKQAEETFVPVIEQTLSEFTSQQMENLAIHLTLGTAQLGPRGEIKAPSVFDKERVSLNEKLYNKAVERRRNSKAKNAAGMFGEAEIMDGLKRQWITECMNDVATYEKFAVAVGAIGGKAFLSSGRKAMSAIPIVGTFFFAGALATANEMKTTTELRGQWLIESAEGYNHPSGANAVRTETMKLTDYHRIDMNLRTKQLTDVIPVLTAEPTHDNILLTIAYLADSKARIALGDKGGYSLFTASKDTGEGRGIYSAEETIHNKARVLATKKLSELLDGPNNTALRTSIASAMGIDLALAHDSSGLIQVLSNGQERHLKTGTTVSDAFMTVMGKNAKLMIQEAQSIDARDKLFNKARWSEGIKHGVTVGVFSALFSAWAMNFRDLHAQVVHSGVESGPITVLDHTYPLHVVGLPNNAGEIISPTSSEVIDHTFTHIPQNSHWVEDVATPGSYDLVLETNDVHKVLLDNATFSDNGHLNLTSSINEDIMHNNLSVEHIAHTPISIATVEAVPGTAGVDTKGWTYEMKYGDFPDQDLDAHYAQTFRQSLSADPNLVPAGVSKDPVRYINAMRFLHRATNLHVIGQDNVHLVANGYDRDINFGESMYDSEYLVKGQPDNAVMTKLPSFIATQEGNAKYYKLVAESLQQGESGHFTDTLHEVVYRTANEGTEDFIPDKNETFMILDYLGENTTSTAGTAAAAGSTITPYDVIITATEDVTVVGEVPYEKVINATVWNPAILLVPTPDIFVPLAYPVVSETTRKNLQEITPFTPGPIPQGPTRQAQTNNLLPGPVQTPSAEEQAAAIRLGKPAVAEVEPKGPKVFTQEELNEMLQKFSVDAFKVVEKNAEYIAKNTTEGKVSSIAVANILKEVADNNQLPLAFIMRDGRPLLLTRGPLAVKGDPGKSEVYFFNFETGKEDVVVVTPSALNAIHFSAESNFPNKSKVPHNTAMTNYPRVFDYLADQGYDLRGLSTKPNPLYAEAKAKGANDLWYLEVGEIAFLANVVKTAKSQMPPGSPPNVTFPGQSAETAPSGDGSKIDVASLNSAMSEIDALIKEMENTDPSAVEVYIPIFEPLTSAMNEVIKDVDELQKNGGDVAAHIESLMHDPKSSLSKSISRLQAMQLAMAEGIKEGKDEKAILEEFLAKEKAKEAAVPMDEVASQNLDAMKEAAARDGVDLDNVIKEVNAVTKKPLAP